MASGSQALTVRAGIDVPLPAVAIVFAYAVVLFAPQVLNDGDTYWHIAAGQWMLHHEAIPRADPFSFSRPGTPWVAHEWLSELIMGAAFAARGWRAVAVLFAAATALAVGLLARSLGQTLDRPAAWLVLMVAGACISPGLLARPHILALPALTLWTAGLLRARRDRRAPSLLLLPLMTLWANLHGSFVFGLALTLPFAVEAVIDAADDRRIALRGWGGFIAASVAAAAVTPQGWHGLIFPFRLMSMQYLTLLDEWQPPKFATLQPIEIALLALLFLSLTRGIRMPPLRVLIVLGLLHLAVLHARQQLVAGVVGALILADPLTGAFVPRQKPGAVVRAWWFPALVGLVLLTTLRAALPLVRTDSPTSPVSALAHVPPELARTPVFNDYGFGGYLIFQGVRPFVDGRADMYGDAFLFAALAATQRPLAFARLAEQYRFSWTIFPAGSDTVGMLDAMPGWQRLYADPVAVVHIRAARPPAP